MKRATVIIGAGLGDCGKGLLTDYYAAALGANGLVVRFNSGAQAGHTVCTPDGKRHVFSHFGAGTFAGTPTFLSRFFVVNPILFFKELNLLGLTPRVYVDPNCLLTTPYDMMINQIIEAARGDNRHGSCGVGFGETIERNLHDAYRLTVADIALPNFAYRLNTIRSDYVPVRLKQLGVVTYDDQYIMSDAIRDAYIAESQAFLGMIRLTDESILRFKQNLIFEGAQGLLLDQDHQWFPHVTRSNTGLKNVVALTRPNGIDVLDVTYVTRAYMTRHGAGPFPFECEGLPYRGIVDQTNVLNEFQGSLRFGYLDLDLLHASITNDLRAGIGIEVRHQLAVTCLDQISADESPIYILDGQRRTDTKEGLIFAAMEAAGTSAGLISEGPTRETISQWNAGNRLSVRRA